MENIKKVKQAMKRYTEKLFCEKNVTKSCPNF